MARNPLARLPELGQSVWYDHLRRDLLDGELERLVAQDELRGLTSNPSIFEQGIAASALYDDEIRDAPAEASAAEIFEHLAVADVRGAADQFRPVFDRTGGLDGYVSLEVSPELAHDAAGTIAEARRLFAACDRKNVMIKIPGTKAGLDAIETCLSEGIHINITLLFSVERYLEVVERWYRALESRLEADVPPAEVAPVASVASFFVSRVDTLVDAEIDARLASGRVSGAVRDRLEAARSRLGIANARRAYAAFEREVLGNTRFRKLASLRVRPQRPLWASTSTKDPRLPPTFYVEALVGPHTVDTMPPATFEAYRTHGDPAVRVRDDLAAGDEAFAAIAAAGIDFAAVTERLEREGVAKFAESYRKLLAAIEKKREVIRATSRR